MLSDKSRNIEKRTIISYIPSQQWDTGIRKHFLLLCAEWVKTGCHVVIICSDCSGMTEEGFHCAVPPECELYYIKTDESSRVRNVIEKLGMMKIIVRKYPNAVFLGLFNPAIRLFSISKLLWHIKMVVAERNDPRMSPPQIRKRIIRNICFSIADKCIFQTSEVKELFPLFIQNKATVIPNLVNPKIPLRYEGKRRDTFVAVGRLTKQKNYPLLLQAFGMLLEEFPNYTLEIYGEGEEKKNLMELCQKEKLTEQVSFMGFTENVLNKIIDAKGYVMSSDFEGQSNSMLEALCIGLPVICTDYPSGGARKLIYNGKNGILVPVGDAHAIYKGMKRIIMDEAFAMSIASEATKIKKRYRADAIAEKWLSVIFS